MRSPYLKYAVLVVLLLFAGGSDWLQWLTEANPMTHFIVICKAILVKDASAEVVLRHLWPMALIALAAMSAATWLLRRRVG